MVADDDLDLKRVAGRRAESMAEDREVAAFKLLPDKNIGGSKNGKIIFDID